MPKSSRRRPRRMTAASRGGSGLFVFSVDHPVVDAKDMARLLGAIAVERQADLEGHAVPHLAGRDRLAELRPATPDVDRAAAGEHADDGETEARDA